MLSICIKILFFSFLFDVINCYYNFICVAVSFWLIPLSLGFFGTNVFSIELFHLFWPKKLYICSKNHFFCMSVYRSMYVYVLNEAKMLAKFREAKKKMKIYIYGILIALKLLGVFFTYLHICLFVCFMSKIF